MSCIKFSWNRDYRAVRFEISKYMCHMVELIYWDEVMDQVLLKKNPSRTMFIVGHVTRLRVAVGRRSLPCGPCFLQAEKENERFIGVCVCLQRKWMFSTEVCLHSKSALNQFCGWILLLRWTLIVSMEIAPPTRHTLLLFNLLKFFDDTITSLIYCRI